MEAEFLGTPGEIRTALVKGLKAAKRLDAAVAFVTAEWADVLGNFPGACRVLCWLTSTNTDPYAVDLMMDKKGMKVRPLHAMHAKVYLMRGDVSVAVVGSSNLSSAALSEEGTAGNVEAGMLVTEAATLKAISGWFVELWEESDEINDDDLDAAKKAFDKRKPSGSAPKKKSPLQSTLPPSWSPSAELEKLAKKVRSMTPSALCEEVRECPLLEDLVPANLTRDDLEELVAALSTWAGHYGSFKRVHEEKLSRVRAAFQMAFDESLPVQDRLEALDDSHKLVGLGIPAWTMILYWRNPPRYPPFNVRTKRFVKDMGLAGSLPKTVNPTSYYQWSVLARALAARLALPSAGHVDRLVWLYTKDMNSEELRA